MFKELYSITYFKVLVYTQELLRIRLLISKSTEKKFIFYK